MYSPSTPRRRLPSTPRSARSTPAQHKRLDYVKSADPIQSGWLSPEMKQPLRSQSFKYRARPIVDQRNKSPLEEVSQERRRSTPTIHRRASLQRQRLLEPRRDVWPEPKPASEVEERFLKLPISDDYTRVRQFNIDAKGAVVSRGDSFRKKRPSDKSPSPYAISCDSARESRSESISSGEETQRKGSGPNSTGAGDSVTIEETPASTSHQQFKVYVIGDTGTGKSALISQFNSSEYKNAFADEIEEYENTVSISIGGNECDLIFFESQMNDPCFLTDEVDAFLVVYGIDSRSSFKQAINGVEMIRAEPKLQHIPIVMAGNKADLERKRAVPTAEVRLAAAQHCFEYFEISVALNHDVDDLLIGLLAEIKEAFASGDEMRQAAHEPRDRERKDDFRAAIRRYSQRKKKDTDVSPAVSKCSSLSPSVIFNKLKQWRRSISPRVIS